MGSDRELLEMAARAAGKLFDPTVKNPSGLEVVKDNAKCQSELELWNPLLDDGDAMRLAVKLSLTVEFSSGVYNYCSVFTDEQVWGASIERNVLGYSENSDPYKAARYAITEAAAKIGKAML